MIARSRRAVRREIFLEIADARSILTTIAAGPGLRDAMGVEMSEICRVLVIEPSELFRDFLDAVVDHAGFDVAALSPAQEPERLLAHERFDAVILASDLGAKGPGAVALAELAAAKGTAVIVALDDAAHRGFFANGRYLLLEKPIRPGVLIARLKELRDTGAIDCLPRNA
jgi:DNA-binding NtrC family response regulator